MDNRDDFSERTKTILRDRVGCKCSNPSCRKETSGPHPNPDKRVLIGQAAHISAAAPGGPRYDESLTSEERKSVSNGIWLCENCAKLIDSNPAEYPVALLNKWKADAEYDQYCNLAGFVSKEKACHDDIERYEGKTYITFADDQSKIKYCSTCWDVEGKKVQVYCCNGMYQCSHCNNNGVYDDKEASEYRLNHMPRRRILSKGIEL